MKAFPLKSVNMFDDNDGMDLRDYFAAKAMAELISVFSYEIYETQDQQIETITKSSYLMADAMMKAREQ